MKKRHESRAGLLFICLSALILLSCAGAYSADKAYSKEAEKIAEKIVNSHNLYIEGEIYYKKRDYGNARIKFGGALAEDPKNKKAAKLLADCNKRMDKQKAGLEKRAWGIFGAREKGLEALLADLPAKYMPTGKLTLRECTDIALRNSIELRASNKHIKLAERRLWEARRNLGPSINAGWEEESGKIYSQDYYGRKLKLEGSQPIYHGGELIYSAGQARVNLDIARHEYDRIKNEIVLKVGKGYYSFDKAIKFYGFQTGLNTTAQRLNDFTEKGYKAGVVSELEFLNSASKYGQIYFQFISAEEDMLLAKLMLQQAINTEEDIDITLLPEPDVKKDISLEECYSLAYSNRPEIKVNFLMTEYQLYEKKIMGAKGFPQIDAMGSYGLAVENYSDPEAASAADLSNTEERKLGPEWYGGFKVSWPFFGNTASYSLAREHWQPVVGAFHGTDSLTHYIKFGLFDDLKYYTNYAEADAGFERAKQEYNRVKMEIALEVKESFFNYKKAILQMDVAKAKVKYQSKQVGFLEAKRSLDEVPASNVLEEMVRLSEEEFSLFQAVSNYYTAIKSLNKAVGITGFFDRGENKEGDKNEPKENKL